MHLHRFLILLPLTGVLASCGTMKNLTTATSSGVGKMGESIGSGFDKMAQAATSPFQPKIPVVEARPEDFQKMETGHEKALAYQEKQRAKRSMWSSLFSGPSDFEEPTLPEMADFPADGGLLPPKN